MGKATPRDIAQSLNRHAQDSENAPARHTNRPAQNHTSASVSPVGAINSRMGWHPPVTYGDVWTRFSDAHYWGAKGELTEDEARETHARWKRLGKMVAAGTYMGTRRGRYGRRKVRA